MQQSDVKTLIKQLCPKLCRDAVLWFAYPKKISKHYQSDISRDHGWQALAKLGFEGDRQVAIDEDWSALRFRHVDFIKSLPKTPKMLSSKQARSKQQKA